MELAFPQSWIKQASLELIQGDNSQRGTKSSLEYTGNMEPLNSGVHSTHYITGKMAIRPVFTQADSASEWKETPLTSTSLSRLRIFPSQNCMSKSRPHQQPQLSPGWQVSGILDLNSARQIVIISQILNRFVNTWLRKSQVINPLFSVFRERYVFFINSLY